VHDLRNVYIDELGERDEIEIRVDGDGRCHAVVDVERYYHENQETESMPMNIKTSFSSDHINVGDKVELIVEIEPAREMESVMMTIPIPSAFKFNTGCLQRMGDFSTA